MAVLGVAVIASCAVLLSYNGIYQVAVRGGADGWTAHLYPALFTLLLLMAFWTTYLLREAPRRRRVWVDLLVLVMILLAAAASALRSFRYELLEWVATLVVAVAPWAALLISFRLMLWIVAQVRGERSSGHRPVPADVDDGAADEEEPDPDRTAARAPAVAPPLPPVDRAPEEPEPVPTPPGSPAPLPDPVADTGPYASEPLSAADNWTADSAPPLPDLFDGPHRPEPDGGVRGSEPDSVSASGFPPDSGGDRLPRRVPASGSSAIRQAAAPRDDTEKPSEPTGSAAARRDADRAAPDTAWADDADWESVDDLDDWESASPLTDDPAGDEAHSAVGAVDAPEPSSGAEPEASASEDSEADTVPPEDAEAETAIRRRPMVLKPRRSGIPPLRPPSSEVRSTPTPPEE
ncbi:DUF2637 domain-containing protein [Thermobifida halotolerans]|nr:DUF2637 domain-containing protein [Thermobifida halotolerans]